MRYRSLSALVRAVLVVILAVSAVSMASPCADDLLVESGAGPERCIGGASEGTTAPDAPVSVCPCACHMAVAVDGTPSSEPMMPAEEIEPSFALHDLGGEPPPISHPPLA